MISYSIYVFVFKFSDAYIIFLQVRIFNYLGDHSREIYHTKRMQRFFFVPTLSVSFHLLFLVAVGALIFRPKSRVGSLYFNINHNNKTTTTTKSFNSKQVRVG